MKTRCLLHMWCSTEWALPTTDKYNNIFLKIIALMQRSVVELNAYLLSVSGFLCYLSLWQRKFSRSLGLRWADSDAPMSCYGILWVILFYSVLK